MSTIAVSNTIYPRKGVTMERQLRPELEEVVSDLLALKEMQRNGILTFRSQRELVKNLSTRDLADVARAVSLAEKEMKKQ